MLLIIFRLFKDVISEKKKFSREKYLFIYMQKTHIFSSLPPLLLFFKWRMLFYTFYSHFVQILMLLIMLGGLCREREENVYENWIKMKLNWRKLRKSEFFI